MPTLAFPISETPVCLVSFVGFLRFHEACNIRWCDIVFKETHFSLHIPRSKTDQYGSGSTRVVARTGNPTCPFSKLRKYAQLSGDGLNSTEFVFRSLSKGKDGSYSLCAGYKLSYSRTRELFMQNNGKTGINSPVSTPQRERRKERPLKRPEIVGKTRLNDETKEQRPQQ